MSDEELDNLFRKSTESFDPPYDPEAWSAMEQKLDGAAITETWWMRFLYPMLVLLFTGTLVVSVWLLQDQEHTETQADAPTKQFAQSKQESSIEQHEIKQYFSAGEFIINDSYLTGKVNHNLHERAFESVGPWVENVERNQSSYKVKPLALDKGLVRASLKPLVKTDNQELKNKQDTLEQSTLQSPLSEIKTALVQEIEEPNPLAVTTEPEDSSHLLFDETMPVRQTGDSSTSANRKERASFLSHVQLKVVGAPDITTVKFRNPDAISANVGLLVGIPLSERWSLVTGAIWANKHYAATAEDYAPSYDYWSGRNKPESIEATCKVLDVPLNIQYTILNGEKNTIAVSSGLSSYFMLKENYTYHYTYGYKPYSTSAELINRNQHWFGIQNLSVSYSRKVTPSLSVGIEPFVKFPLSGIGAGQVKLSSAGVFFSAGYSLSLKK